MSNIIFDFFVSLRRLLIPKTCRQLIHLLWIIVGAGFGWVGQPTNMLLCFLIGVVVADGEAN